MNLRNSVLFSLPFVFFACGEPDNQPDLTWHGKEEFKKAFETIIEFIKKSGEATIPKAIENVIKILENALDDTFVNDLKKFTPSKNADLFYGGILLSLVQVLYSGESDSDDRNVNEILPKIKQTILEELDSSRKAKNENKNGLQTIKNDSFSCCPVYFEDLTFSLEEWLSIVSKFVEENIMKQKSDQFAIFKGLFNLVFVEKLIDSQNKNFGFLVKSFNKTTFNFDFDDEFINKYQENNELGDFFITVCHKFISDSDWFEFSVADKYKDFVQKLVDGIKNFDDFKAFKPMEPKIQNEKCVWRFTKPVPKR